MRGQVCFSSIGLASTLTHPVQMLNCNTSLHFVSDLMLLLCTVDCLSSAVVIIRMRKKEEGVDI